MVPRLHRRDASRQGPQHASATIGYLGAGVVKVWSTNWTGLPAGVYDLWKLRQVAGIEDTHFTIPDIRYEHPEGYRLWTPGDEHGARSGARPCRLPRPSSKYLDLPRRPDRGAPGRGRDPGARVLRHCDRTAGALPRRQHHPALQRLRRGARPVLGRRQGRRRPRPRSRLSTRCFLPSWRSIRSAASAPVRRWSASWPTTRTRRRRSVASSTTPSSRRC